MLNVPRSHLHTYKIANKRMHTDKIKLRRFAMHLYFAGGARRRWIPTKSNLILLHYLET